MKSYRAAINISAETQTIWRVLTDAANYAVWDPGTEKLEGKIAKGQKLVAHSKIKAKRPFKYTVTDIIPGISMTWKSGLGLGLFQRARKMALSRNNDGTVEFTIIEEVGGLFLPFVGKNLPDLSRPFRLFATALKERAETGVHDDSLDRVLVRE